MAALMGALGGSGAAAGTAGAAGAADAAAAGTAAGAGTAGLSAGGLGAGASLASGLEAFGPAASAAGGYGGLLNSLGSILGQFGSPTSANASGLLGFGQGLGQGLFGGMSPLGNPGTSFGLNAPTFGNILGQIGQQQMGGAGGMRLPAMGGATSSGQHVLPGMNVQPGKDKLDVLGLGLNLFPGSPQQTPTAGGSGNAVQDQLQRRMQLLQQAGLL